MLICSCPLEEVGDTTPFIVSKGISPSLIRNLNNKGLVNHCATDEMLPVHWQYIAHDDISHYDAASLPSMISILAATSNQTLCESLHTIVLLFTSAGETGDSL